MIIANLIGKSKLRMLDNTEQAQWIIDEPFNDDVIFNTDTKTLVRYDGTEGAAVDIGSPVTTWRHDSTAPTGTSYVTVPETINKTILLFMLDGVPFRIMDIPATVANQVFFDPLTGEFELQIDVTPAVQFNGEWLSIIYNNQPATIIT